MNSCLVHRVAWPDRHRFEADGWLLCIGWFWSAGCPGNYWAWYEKAE